MDRNFDEAITDIILKLTYASLVLLQAVLLVIISEASPINLNVWVVAGLKPVKAGIDTFSVSNLHFLSVRPVSLSGCIFLSLSPAALSSQK